MVWIVLLQGLRTYAPYIVAPVAAVIGVIGYNVEKWVRHGDLSTPYIESIKEEREERLLKETFENDPTQISSLKDRKGIPRTIFDKNERIA